MNTPKEIKCRLCRKEIKSVIYECKLCIKSFHPSCAKLHNVINAKNQLVTCRGQIEIVAISADNKDEDQIQKHWRDDEEETGEDVTEVLKGD